MENGSKFSLSLGEELKKARLKKHLSLEKIAKETRISVIYLESLENNQFDFLSRPYVLAFLKTYARKLGLDEEEIIERLNSQTRSPAVQVEPLASIQPVNTVGSKRVSGMFTSLGPAGKAFTFRRPGRRIILMLTIAVFLIIVSLLQNILNEPESAPVPKNLKSAIPPQTAESAQETVVMEYPLELRIATRERLWIRIILDGGEPAEYLFAAGETRTWTAQETIEIRAGKSTGFDLIFNGTPLQNLGTDRTLISRLVLTKDGIAVLQHAGRGNITPPDSSNVQNF